MKQLAVLRAPVHCANLSRVKNLLVPIHLFLCSVFLKRACLVLCLRLLPAIHPSKNAPSARMSTALHITELQH